jgi:hypothetical protein
MIFIRPPQRPHSNGSVSDTRAIEQPLPPAKQEVTPAVAPTASKYRTAVQSIGGKKGYQQADVRIALLPEPCDEQSYITSFAAAYQESWNKGLQPLQKKYIAELKLNAKSATAKTNSAVFIKKTMVEKSFSSVTKR